MRRHGARLMSRHREGQRGRPGQAGRRTIDGDTADRAQPVPHPCEQGFTSRVKAGVCRIEALAAGVALAERRQEVHRRRDACHVFVALRPGLEALGRGLGRARQPRHVEAVEQLGGCVHHSRMRAIELVGGAGEEVAAQGPRRRKHVGYGVHGVDDGPRAELPGPLDQRCHVGDGAERVGCPGQGDDPCVPVERALEGLDVQGAVLDLERHLP